MYVDVSGSTHGDNELWLQSSTYCVEECTNNNRPVYVRLFNSTIADTIDIKPNTKDSDDMLKFIEWPRWYFFQSRDGRCSSHEIRNVYTCSSSLMVSEVEDHTYVSRKPKTIRPDVRGFCIGKKSESMEKFCDEVVLILLTTQRCLMYSESNRMKDLCAK